MEKLYKNNIIEGHKSVFSLNYLLAESLETKKYGWFITPKYKPHCSVYKSNNHTVFPFSKNISRCFKHIEKLK